MTAFDGTDAGDRCTSDHALATAAVTPVAAVIAELAIQLRAEGARAAVVIGSVAQGVATDHSDVDLLVIAQAESTRPPFERTVLGTRLVEIVSKTNEAWLAHLESARPRWLYALLDPGPVLFDDGSVVSLRARSEEVFVRYETPAEVKIELATILWHSQAKLERAALSEDPRSASYWAGIVLPGVLDALFALHGRPTVPGSRRMAVLSSLTLHQSDEQLLQVAFHGAPRERLDALRSLASSLLERLGPPDLERLEW